MLKKMIQAHIATKEEAAQRYEVCKTCVMFAPTTRLCTDCGCFMPAKTKLRQAGCPRGLWQPIKFTPTDVHYLPENDEWDKNL